MIYGRTLFLLVLLAYSLNGCGGYLAYIDSPHKGKTQTFLKDLHAEPGVTVTFSESEYGWLLHAEQAVTAQQVTETTVTQKVQRYVFFPPVMLVGIFQCPFGGLVYAFSGGSIKLQVRNGCHRLVMLEPLDGNPEGPITTTQTSDTIRMQQPARGRPVRIETPDRITTLVGYTNDQGILVIPLELVQSSSANQPSQTKVQVLEENAVLWQQLLPPHTGQRGVPHAAPPWPTPLVVEFEPLSSGASLELARFQTRMQFLLGTMEYCVVADERRRSMGREELGKGLREESRGGMSVESLKWTPASVLVQTALEEGQYDLYGIIRWKNIATGELIDLTRVPAALSRNEEVMKRMLRERLPKKGQC